MKTEQGDILRRLQSRAYAKGFHVDSPSGMDPDPGVKDRRREARKEGNEHKKCNWLSVVRNDGRFSKEGRDRVMPTFMLALSLKTTF